MPALFYIAKDIQVCVLTAMPRAFRFMNSWYFVGDQMGVVAQQDRQQRLTFGRETPKEAFGRGLCLPAGRNRSVERT